MGSRKKHVISYERVIVGKERKPQGNNEDVPGVEKKVNQQTNCFPR